MPNNEPTKKRLTATEVANTLSALAGLAALIADLVHRIREDRERKGPHPTELPGEARDDQ